MPATFETTSSFGLSALALPASSLAELDRVAGTQLDADMVRVFKQLVLRGQIVPPDPFITDDLFFGRSADPNSDPSQGAPSKADLGLLLAAGGGPRM